MAGKRFSRSRDFNESSLEKAPKGKPVVYKIKNSDGNNIYTGSAKRGRVTERLKEHLPGGPDPIKGAVTFQVKQMGSIQEARAEEKKIIEKENPKHNKQ
ncbi:MAG: GIY-YIG nuclease family protein [Chloroflexi bacterium]|nr:GIY-YIG nuclease family protein [Chloroflexota bacterium]